MTTTTDPAAAPSAVTSTLPPVVYEAPPAAPIGGGLYAVSTGPLPMPEHWYGGIEIWPVNCASGWGTWPVDPCLNPVDDHARKTGARADPLDPFFPLVVWGYDECSLITQTEEMTLTRARQNLVLHEQTMVESGFADRLLGAATDLGTAPDITTATAMLESALAVRGIAGVLHAGAQWAAPAVSALLAAGSPILRSPLGASWAFGGGYVQALGDTVIATGPTTVWTSPVDEHATPDAMENIMAALAERSVTVGYECFAVAVTIDGEVS
ncbi:hypothetical protein [Gordonia hankookensis]|uniref:Uncharacterized protein n=1 Tax=Gordonia hankookensis TaxID=589403 RepID=A0ABR7W9V1_9ACTN|nr:hypothetical protein [Gordonia hankookensis]MBD1318524.1 hypothetical protein [Gordonia hankookensis]